MTNHLNKLVRLVILAQLLALITQATAQELPQGYFRNPMDHNIGLSATFGEFRANHFHGGLDMRTGGAIGKPVYAAADGYVARVSISPWGGGKILYIHHPNGYNTVYMHLDGYAGAIGKAVEREQYARKSYSISKIFAPDELPVKKGQLVAYSGNSGGSGGPHLHFEVRRGGEEDLHTHSTSINPLLFGLPYTDNIDPVIRGIRIYYTDGRRTDIDKESSVIVDGPFYLGIYATDAAEGSTLRNGPHKVEVFLDGTLFFMYTTDILPVDSIRMDNALIDYKHYSATRHAYLLTRALPGAEGPWVPVRQDDGIFRLAPGSKHSIKVRVYDIKDNIAERTFSVECGNNSTKRDETKSSKDTEPVRYDQPFSFQGESFKVEMAANTMYADDRLTLKADELSPVTTPMVTIKPTVNEIPPQLFYTMSLKPRAPLGVAVENVVVARVTRKPGSFKLTACSTTYGDGWYYAKVRDWGEYTLAIDTTAPTARPINFSEGKPLKGNTIKIKIGDNLSGVNTYNCYLNGEWILGEFDGKSATVTINAAGKLIRGKNKLRVTVTDGTGNCTDLTWNITR